MKAIHWIIFALASWVLVTPFLADDLVAVLFGNTFAQGTNLIKLLQWDDFFLGAAIFVLGLVVVTAEQASHKTPGLKAMHWMQVLLGLWVAISPFALPFTEESYMWSHVVAGGFVAAFALLQINLEHK